MGGVPVSPGARYTYQVSQNLPTTRAHPEKPVTPDAPGGQNRSTKRVRPRKQNGTRAHPASQALAHPPPAALG